MSTLCVILCCTSQAHWAIPQLWSATLHNEHLTGKQRAFLPVTFTLIGVCSDIRPTIALLNCLMEAVASSNNTSAMHTAKSNRNA